MVWLIGQEIVVRGSKHASSSEQLREQATRFMQAADKLIEAADLLDGIAPQDNRTTPQSTSTRLQQLRAFLRENGPLARCKIIARSGIPQALLQPS